MIARQRRVAARILSLVLSLQAATTALMVGASTPRPRPAITRSWRSRALRQDPAGDAAAPATNSDFDCAAALAKGTVLLFPGPEAPYLGDLRDLMPTHKVDVSPGALALLPLSEPSAAACARGLTDITDTLLIWEDGNLTAFKDALPRGLRRTQPRGQLIIKGKDGREQAGLKDLTFLKGLEAVGGLSVYNMDGLVDLRGLEQLTNITGDMIVCENQALRNLTGLDRLQAVAGDVLMVSNMNLRTLDGLGALGSIGGQFLLKGNGYVMNLDALTSLRRIGRAATLVNNGNLKMALPPTIAVGPNAKPAAMTAGVGDIQPGGDDGTLLIIYGGVEPPTVADIVAATDKFQPPLNKFDISVQDTRFQPATEPAARAPGGERRGNVIVYDDGTISSLRPALEGITAITGSLVVLGGVALGNGEGGPGLQNLDGLQSLTAVGELGIVGATQLTDLSGLDGLASIDGNLVIAFCPRLTSLAGLGSESAAVSASSQGVLPPAGLTRVGSEVWLEGNHKLRSLAGLEALEVVSWRFNIRACSALSDLAALRSLRRIGGGLIITECYGLTSLAGMAALEVVGSSVELLWNEALLDIDGLAQLRVLPGDLVIAGSPELTSLLPLGALTHVGLNLVVEVCSGLTDLRGLDALTTVGGTLSVSGNANLASLAGLVALTQVGDDLAIRGNPRLATLAPLDQSLQTVGGGVYIEDNAALASLGGLPSRLAGAGGVAVVRRNGLVPDAEVRTLTAKAGQGNGVPDTVDLLPQVISLRPNDTTATSLADMREGDLLAMLRDTVSSAAVGTTNGSAAGTGFEQAQAISAFGA